MPYVRGHLDPGVLAVHPRCIVRVEEKLKRLAVPVVAIGAAGVLGA